ncbi:SDR family NAD(P)-dependent oxidoreductase [Actinophytocola algeriensis]|uniref:NAD(P)-dependent dehydrogenase (Short-subunit alcohol dehydrogenase family) n=1 Tax=Actinophytocola algeriensis TaxID=1768010 RepID=A0A7W7Q0X6_9PSEU|nr:SDR family NAD(P)-dependent oxidoreductase [Actinophytocola algeriensis]MBB4904944.1 NAD(P)-dependent dehydrogenase (short-subunit alcohol dehydrogenase family) [Actinophytocola algeriensis]MBE1476196.1 NAD(P)-dependent dehydrogenase (short-subunit alcohol dehydrogenase family) [Actinophytocola algeriensis]
MSTWFVTGTSRGLGLELVKQLLDRGHDVAATTRSTARLTTALAGADTTRLLPIELDLADERAVAAAVTATTGRFGGLDVVVNNAGYGFLAAVEETTDADARAMFDVQVFGVWNVLRAALPVLRAQRGGHVVNVSSILGLTALPGWGLYCAGKFALEGLTESLAAEVADLGITVTAVEPGYFRTGFLTTDSLALPAETADGYADIRETTRDHLALQGSQLGDPVKGATAIVSLVESGDGPRHQLLGSDACVYATAKVKALTEDIDAGRELAHSTDHA